MAAGKDQTQALVRNRLIGLGVAGFFELRKDLALGRLVTGGCGASYPVDGPPSRHRQKPRGPVARRSVTTPADKCFRHGVLQGIFGEVEIPELSYQNGQDGARILLVDAGEHFIVSAKGGHWRS